ncbi:hypothetical protein GCM10029978_067180 [Actinoallomurus acanthiterrae]
MGTKILLSLGMGVDSVGILTRWLTEPSSRDFDLSDLICVTAMTGDEFDATRRLMETHVLPLMREFSIRYVQIARAGQADEAGYDVLDDSTQPQRMHMAGRWRLSDELRAAGTVPTYAHGKRLCSWRAKGSVLDRWRADHLPGEHFIHVIGFSAEETWCMERDIASYTSSNREPWFPLADWAWTRDVTAGYLHERFGEWWSRSCCVYCPFQNNKASVPELVTRWRVEPQAAAAALVIEHRALALNPRTPLFSSGTAAELAVANHLDEAISLFHDRLASTAWAVYDVRRVYHARKGDPARKGPAWRSVVQCTRGTRKRVHVDLARLAARMGARTVTDRHGITRAELIPLTQRYPAPERMLVAGPSGVVDKERPGFAAAWNALVTAPQLDLFA